MGSRKKPIPMLTPDFFLLHQSDIFTSHSPLTTHRSPFIIGKYNKIKGRFCPRDNYVYYSE
jgi:hypothetical protein